MKHTIIALFLIFGLSAGYGQDSSLVRDFETWTSIGFKSKLGSKKMSFGFDLGMRFDDNSSELNSLFGDFDLKYKIYKDLSAGIGYRLYRKDESGNATEKEHRFNFDLMYKHKIDRLSLDYRFRMTNRNERGMTVSEGDHNEVKYRLRARVAYNIKNWKLDPYLSAEAFYASGYHTINFISDVTEGYEVNAFQKYRITIGTKYKTGDLGQIGMFYRIERQVGSYPFAYNPTTWHIAGISYKFKL